MEDWSEVNDLPVCELIDKYCGNSDELDAMIVEVSTRVEQLKSRSSPEGRVPAAAGDMDDSSLLGTEHIRDRLLSVHATAKHSAEELRVVSSRRKELTGEIERHITRTEAFFSFLTENVSSLKKYEKERDDALTLKQFLKIVDKLSSTISQSVPDSIILYSKAVEVYEKLPRRETTSEIESSALASYMYTDINQWAVKLSSSIKEEFLKLMTKLGWPNHLTQCPLKGADKDAVISRRDYLFYQLLGLQIPKPPARLNDEEDISDSSKDVDDQIPPITVLLSFFRKRFFYHFYGDKATNSIEKPEWYFTQVIKWILQVKEYLIKEIQPLLENAGHSHIWCPLEFSRGLMKLVHEKVLLDLPTVTSNEALLCHYIDEILSFDRDVISVLDVSRGSLRPVQSILVEDQVFHKWIALEANSVKEKMDEILSSSSHWTAEVSDDSELRFIPKSANLFLTLLDSISKRYENLPSIAHRRQFLDMQLELLDEYRTRLIQLKNTHLKSGQPVLSETVFGVMNSASYVMEVLGRWADETMYIMLSLKCENPLGVEESDLDVVSVSPFDYYRDCLGLVVDDLEMVVSRAVIDQFRARLPEYKNQRWTIQQEKGGKSSKHGKVSKVSTPAVDLFLVLSTQLELVSNGVNSRSSRRIWQQVARMVDKTVYLEMILKCNYSSVGKEQFLYDIQHSLIPVFGQFTSSPHNFLPHISDSCKLLQLSPGSAILLKQTLREDPKSSSMVSGEYKLSVITTADAILRVLSRRTELSDFE